MRKKINCVVCASHRDEPEPLHCGRNKSLARWELIVKGTHYKTCSPKCSGELRVLTRQRYAKQEHRKAWLRIYRILPEYIEWYIIHKCIPGVQEHKQKYRKSYNLNPKNKQRKRDYNVRCWKNHILELKSQEFKKAVKQIKDDNPDLYTQKSIMIELLPGHKSLHRKRQRAVF